MRIPLIACAAMVLSCCIGDNLPAPIDCATPVDAAPPDACTCEPHWPTCPDGCAPAPAPAD